MLTCLVGRCSCCSLVLTCLCRFGQAIQDIERQASSLQACTAANENGHGRDSHAPSGQAALQWYDIGRGRLLARYPGLLCEFDAELRAPIGAVFVNMGEST